MFCREQVAQLRDIVSEIRQVGAELVVVGNGSSRQAARFRDDLEVNFPLFTDPRLQTFRAAGLTKSLVATFTPKILDNFKRSWGGGFRQKWIQGSPFQQGGTFVITPQGEVAFEYRSQAAGEHADPQEILGALRKVGEDP